MSNLHYKDFHTFSVRTDGATAWITFLPPVSVHTTDLLQDLDHLAGELEHDNSVKVAVFQSAHAEVFVCSSYTTFRNPPSPDSPLRLNAVLQRLAGLPQATIAKVEGAAHGAGFELALACDMRFAARGKASFALAKKAVGGGGAGGLQCGGATARLARLVGLGRALELALRPATPVDASMAERYGVVNRAFEPEELGIFVSGLATGIARDWPAASAVAACKKSVLASVDVPVAEAVKMEQCMLSGLAGDSTGSASTGSQNRKGMLGSPKAVVEILE